MAGVGKGALFAALLFFPSLLFADVFWRIGGGRGDGGISPSAEAWPGVASASAPFFREEVSVNGSSGSLAAWSSRASFGELVEWLRGRFPGAKIRRTGHVLRICEGSAGSWESRWLIVDGGRGACTIFRLTLPRASASAVPVWPEALDGVLPPGAAPVTVVAAAGRGMIYGSFRGAGAGSGADALRRIAGRLRSGGWRAVGGETSSAIGGKGELFLKEGSRQLLWVGMDDFGNGVCCLSGKP